MMYSHIRAFSRWLIGGVVSTINKVISPYLQVEPQRTITGKWRLSNQNRVVSLKFDQAVPLSSMSIHGNSRATWSVFVKDTVSAE